MYKYQENILKSLKKYFGKEIHQLYKKYIDIEEQYNLKKITKKKFTDFMLKSSRDIIKDSTLLVVSHIMKNKSTILKTINNEKKLSASTLDSWATAKIMINILERNKNITGSIFNNKNKKIRDFVNLLQNIGELSLKARKSLNTVLPK